MKKILKAFFVFALLLCTACAKEESSSMRISILQAGKADAILIETENGNVLIDSGLEENKDDLLAFLSQNNITELYALIITHFDKDHVGGADWVMDTLKVKHVYTSYETNSSDDITSFKEALQRAGINAFVIKGTQTFRLGDVTFDVNGASGNYEKDESNNSSLILRVTYGAKTYLFMGDAQNERIEEYLSSCEADADFLKVPYHGHYQKTLSALFSAVSPEVSVITCSQSEPDQKELNKTRSLLAECGSETYETLSGTITLLCGKDGFSVSQ